MNNIYLVHYANNKVYMENMPNTEAPKINEWVNKLDEQVKELDENIYFIGHSIGCQTILRYLESKDGCKENRWNYFDSTMA